MKEAAVQYRIRIAFSHAPSSYATRLCDPDAICIVYCNIVSAAVDCKLIQHCINCKRQYQTAIIWFFVRRVNANKITEADKELIHFYLFIWKVLHKINTEKMYMQQPRHKWHCYMQREARGNWKIELARNAIHPLFMHLRLLRFSRRAKKLENHISDGGWRCCCSSCCCCPGLSSLINTHLVLAFYIKLYVNLAGIPSFPPRFWNIVSRMLQVGIGNATRCYFIGRTLLHQTTHVYNLWRNDGELL